MDRKDIYAIGILAALTLLLMRAYLFIWPTPLIYPESTLGTDLPREIWPLAFYIKDNLLSAGILPLWRLYLLSGAPLIGHPVAPIFYPPNWLILALPLATAFNILLVLHLIWMGFGTFLYLRIDTGASRIAALIGAVLFSQAPKWIAHISGGHLPMIAAISWWPWIWLGANRYYATGRYRWVVLTGIALAAQAMNHGMYAVLSILALSTATLIISIMNRGKNIKRIFIGFAITFSLAAGLSAIQLLPLIELIPYTTRASATYAVATFSSLPPALLLNAIFPPSLKYPEWYLYPGIGILAFLTYLTTSTWTKREWIPVLVIIVCTVLSLGSYTPIYRLLYHIIPGYSFLRVPPRWWIFSLFAFSVLSAWGVDKWLTGGNRSNRRSIIIMIAIITLYTTAVFFQLFTQHKIPFDILPSALMIIAIFLILLTNRSSWALALISILVVLELNIIAARLLRPQPVDKLIAEDPLTSLLISSARNGERSFAPYGGINSTQLAMFDLRAAEGYDSILLYDYSNLGKFASGCTYSDYAVSVPPTISSPEATADCPEFQPQEPVLALLNVRYIILPSTLQSPIGDLVLEHNGQLVYEVVPGYGRAFGVSAGTVTTPEQCIANLSSVNLATEVLIEDGDPFETNGSPPSVLSSQRSANQEHFRIEASHPGILVRSESWAPGWKATIDGNPTEILKVDCALQGVWIEPGDQTVTFTYSPTSFHLGYWITVGTLTLLLGWIIVSFISRILRNGNE